MCLPVEAAGRVPAASPWAPRRRPRFLWPYLGYIDLNPVLFTHGEPRMELYRPDGLHFHQPAHDEFTGIIKPVLTHAWREVGKSLRWFTGGNELACFGRPHH